MSIQFNIKKPQTDTQVSVSLKASRVEKILHSGSLDEAQRMGVFDKIKDIFRGGVKAEAIRVLYNQLTAPEPHDAHPVDMLHRLDRLRDLTDPDLNSYSGFVGKVVEDPALKEGQWMFKLFAAGETIYQSGILEDVPGTSKTDFIAANAAHRAINQHTDQLRTNKMKGKTSGSDGLPWLDRQLGHIMNQAGIKGSTKAEVFAFVRNLQPVHNPYLQKLTATNYSEKSLLSLHFGPPQVEEAEQLAKFDNARDLLTPEFFSQLADATALADKSISERTVQQDQLSSNRPDLLGAGTMEPRDSEVLQQSHVLADLCKKQLGLESDTHDLFQLFLQNLHKYGPAELAENTFDALRKARLSDTDLLTLWMGDLAPQAKPQVEWLAPDSFA